MLAAALAILMAVAAPPAPPSVPPPAVAPTQANERGLAVWTPGEVRCEGGVAVAGEPIRRPWSSIGWTGATNRQPVTLGFDIDATGRPVSIHRDDRRMPPNPDIAPALAASRFPAVARKGCSVSFASSVEPFATAPVADLVSYTVTPTTGRLPQQGWARIFREGTCAEAPRPAPLLRAYPDFAKVPGTPGVKDWTLISYDTDADGRPVNVRAKTGTGSKPLDDAAVEAMRQSRFTGGARTGCSYPYWHQPEVMPAPPMPDKSAFAPAATCPAGREWASAPVLRFPQAYNRRRIEGWAIVSYDIAPWGEVGNARVLAAQPSEDFGQQAQQVIRSAKALASEKGRSGCVDRIRFVIRPDGAADDDADDEPIILTH